VRRRKAAPRSPDMVRARRAGMIAPGIVRFRGGADLVAAADRERVPDSEVKVGLHCIEANEANSALALA
jgi:hypothetical protein